MWNDGDGAAGGGESKVFKKPAFQKGLFTQDKKRDVPDISFGASPGSPGFFYGGRNGQGAAAVVCCIGGTSIGAPAWAGISQLISQANGAPVGNLNTRIYQLGAEANGATTGIRDVTSGNTNYNSVTGFSAASATTKPAAGAPWTWASSSPPIWARRFDDSLTQRPSTPRVQLPRSVTARCG